MVQICVETNAKQWGVQHGGFHTQETELRIDGSHNRWIRIIYDCGSSNKPQHLGPTVGSYVSELVVKNVKKLELIVVSHLDLDHVSGIPELAKQLKAAGIKVERIIAPGLTPLALVALNVVQPFALPRWYQTLIVNPRDYLSEAFPSADVVLLSGDNSRSDPDERGFEFPSESEPGAGTEIQVRQTFNGGLRVTAGAKQDQVIWEALPFVQPIVDADAKVLWRKICSQINGLTTNPAPTRDDMLVVLNSQNRRAAKKIVEGHFAPKSVNFTSISLYVGTGPLSKPFSTWSLSAQSYLHANVTKSQAECSWLGTGDSEFLDPTSLAEFVSFFGSDRLRRVRMVGAPHHGSRHNSDYGFWSNFEPGALGTFHASGRYGLPNSAPMLSVVANQLTPVVVKDDVDAVYLQSVHCFYLP